MKPTARLYLTFGVLTLALFAISSSSVLTKMCDAPAETIALYRVAIASGLYYAMARAGGSSFRSAYTPARLKLAAASGLFLAVHFAAWITSLHYTSVASSVVLVVTSPVWVALGGLIFLGEKPRPLQLVGMAVTLAGSAVVSGADVTLDPRSLFGNLLALVGAMAAAGYWLIGRRLRAEMDTFPYVSVVYAACAVFTLTLILALRRPVWGFSQKTYLLLIAIALFPQVVGHTSLNWALKYFSAAAVAVITLGEPIGATILAWLILGQTVTPVQAAGGAIILVGVALALRAELFAAQGVAAAGRRPEAKAAKRF